MFLGVVFGLGVVVYEDVGRRPERKLEEVAEVDEQQSSEREQGVVKWFSDPKGYGFILRGDDADIFVHHSAIKMDGFRTLKEGDCVVYDLMESPKGLQAANVVPAAGDAEAVAPSQG